MNETTERLKLIVTIVDRGKGNQVAELYKKHGVTSHFIAIGKGTAKTEVLEYMGIEPQREILFSVANEKKVDAIWRVLNEILHFNKAGNGVAFTIPIASVGGQTTLKYFLGLIGKEQVK